MIIKTKDEAKRLRLVLASLSRQTVPIVAPGSRVGSGDLAAELIVVDDGSVDETPTLLDARPEGLPLARVRLDPNRGRSAAANAGAAAACGEVLIFLDGDTLAGPEMVEEHARAHGRAARPFFGRGEHFNLRCTRFFDDPETGTPRAGAEAQVRRMGAELAGNLVTREQVIERFDEVARRAHAGLYPGVGPRTLFEVEWDALVNHPGLPVLWMAASGHNSSLRRSDFEAAGGFDERLSINEHRELALRLQESGVPVGPVPGARTYHLTHRDGWRDPLADDSWERLFLAAHPRRDVELMTFFWRSLAADASIPERARLRTLPELAAAAAASDATG
ncbi:glycosyltransferase [Aquisphaera insulae]|uniref:glycosyltransferase n=1 Tax=Aquisphaera insulae TaxID=2712864 RepID=UPI0013ECFF18|nr:glycosyltransferase [Aquisphaera insulae]